MLKIDLFNFSAKQQGRDSNMVRRDYQRKNLKNPFFKPVRNKKSWRRVLFILFVVIFLGVLIFLLFFSSLFSIKKIEIRGADRTNTVELEAWLWEKIDQPRIFNLPSDNLFLFSSQTIVSPAMTDFDLTSFNVKKSYPQTLLIDLKERQAAFILQANNEEQVRDASACPIKNATIDQEAYSQYPVIRLEDLINDNNCLSLASGYVDDILIIFNLSQEYQEFSPDYFLVNGDNQTINMIIKTGPTVYLNRRDDLDKQLLKLAAVSQGKSVEELTRIEYIDVRYGDKAYIK